MNILEQLVSLLLGIYRWGWYGESCQFVYFVHSLKRSFVLQWHVWIYAYQACSMHNEFLKVCLHIHLGPAEMLYWLCICSAITKSTVPLLMFFQLTPIAILVISPLLSILEVLSIHSYMYYNENTHLVNLFKPSKVDPLSFCLPFYTPTFLCHYTSKWQCNWETFMGIWPSFSSWLALYPI